MNSKRQPGWQCPNRLWKISRTPVKQIKQQSFKDPTFFSQSQQKQQTQAVTCHSKLGRSSRSSRRSSSKSSSKTSSKTGVNDLKTLRNEGIYAVDIIKEKFQEVLMSVLPIAAIVIILHFTLTPMEPLILGRFLVGTVIVILGLTIFLFGVDVGITPIGNNVGRSIARSNKVLVVVAAGLIFGFFISIAEPDLHILANEIDDVTGGAIPARSILVFVSLGIAVMLTIGLLRIVYGLPLKWLMTLAYLVIFILSLFGSPQFFALAFDASGATTGALTVPFMLALGFGVSRLKKMQGASEDDSFGLVGTASTGAILGVLLLGLFNRVEGIGGEISVEADPSQSVLGSFLDLLPGQMLEIAIALAPIALMFLIFQILSFRLSRAVVRRILFGVLFTYIGLVLFLTGVNGGFMELGRFVGYQLTQQDSSFWVIAVGFLLGMVTVLAEPAVHVLTHQIEEVTSGSVKRSLVLVTLSLGVSMAVGLTVIRIIVPGLELWHFVVPGFLIAMLLSFKSPGLFVGMGYDAGGVASGPMTATFILAFAHGVAQGTEGADVLMDGFGVIALVAMMPIITIEVMGMIYTQKAKRREEQ